MASNRQSFRDVMSIECQETGGRYECDVIGWNPEGKNPTGTVEVNDFDFPLGSVFTDEGKIIANPGDGGRLSQPFYSKWDCQVTDDELSCDPYDVRFD